MSSIRRIAVVAAVSYALCTALFAWRFPAPWQSAMRGGDPANQREPAPPSQSMAPPSPVIASALLVAIVIAIVAGLAVLVVVT